jgi:hypothetical protein
VVAAISAAGVAACGSSDKGKPAANAARPAGFTANVDNPLLPLKPGTTLIYEGVKDGRPQRDVFKVTRRTKTVGGVPCRVVDDRVYSAGGRLNERTSDYYAQDRNGSVWYFGEDTAELGADGRVTSTEGTWHTGVKGARAGLFMPAQPRQGEQHRQEYYKGHAEDQFRVVGLHSRIKVPYGDFRGALQTREWTRLEPGVLDAKYYVRGIGEVYEGSLKGPREVFKLVAVKRG